MRVHGLPVLLILLAPWRCLGEPGDFLAKLEEKFEEKFVQVEEKIEEKLEQVEEKLEDNLVPKKLEYSHVLPTAEAGESVNAGDPSLTDDGMDDVDDEDPDEPEMAHMDDAAEKGHHFINVEKEMLEFVKNTDDTGKRDTDDPVDAENLRSEAENEVAILPEKDDEKETEDEEDNKEDEVARRNRLEEEADKRTAVASEEGGVQSEILGAEAQAEEALAEPKAAPLDFNVSQYVALPRHDGGPLPFDEHDVTSGEHHLSDGL